jgi:phage shock protein PspC (stress-responsive transcriptional regulator)
METREAQPALPLRSHTILGVCEGIGEDFGFNPTYLRVPLATMVLWSIEYAIIAYFALGLVVLASRMIFPQKKVLRAEDALAAEAPANEEERADLPLAA